MVPREDKHVNLKISPFLSFPQLLLMNISSDIEYGVGQFGSPVPSVSPHSPFARGEKKTIALCKHRCRMAKTRCAIDIVLVMNPRQHHTGCHKEI